MCRGTVCIKEGFMKQYSYEWKMEQQRKHGGWAQKTGNKWNWHFFKDGREQMDIYDAQCKWMVQGRNKQQP